jgi:hypothetical protein
MQVTNERGCSESHRAWCTGNTQYLLVCVIIGWGMEPSRHWEAGCGKWLGSRGTELGGGCGEGFMGLPCRKAPGLFLTLSYHSE